MRKTIKIAKKILWVIMWPFLRVDVIPFNENGRKVEFCTLFILCIPTISKIYFHDRT
ncbi:hypothetical protein [Epilithonimonas caeni]|uniref:hypothetical protein n=1 Tax=Epilithonimonas caeni TaxID=365343 RepID=UPI00041B9D86|nr:hypothetical protein [Epilithonimonas caeni]